MDGRRVRFWVDRWLSSLPSGCPTSSGVVPVTRDTRVASFLNLDTCSWDLDPLSHFLPEGELNAINGTHIGGSFSEDRLIWEATKNGHYTVKSGYFWAHARATPPLPRLPTSPSAVPTRIWKLVWSLNAPAKIRHFMWRSLHCALPTLVELFKKHVVPSSVCPICHALDESVEHLFFLCPWVAPVWFGGVLNLRIVGWQPPVGGSGFYLPRGCLVTRLMKGSFSFLMLLLRAGTSGKLDVTGFTVIVPSTPLKFCLPSPFRRGLFASGK